MRQSKWVVAALLAVGSVASAQPRPLIQLLDAVTIAARCDGELAKANSELRRLETQPGTAGVLAGIDRLMIGFADFAYPVYLLKDVSPDKAVRDAAQTCLDKLLPFENELYQSEPLYRRVHRLQPKDLVDTVFRQNLLEKFEDGGATLAPAPRARAKEIADELERLNLQFSKNVNEDPTVIVLTPAEAAGMSDAWLAARKRDDAGNLVLGLDYPTVVPFMQGATSEEARRKVWLAKQREGGIVNIELLDRALQLRYELARLHGAPDYATYALKRRMAQAPATVFDFLNTVQGAVDDNEARELEELRADKAQFASTPLAATRLNRWDVEFHQERLRKARYNIDQEALRAYFPTDRSVEYSLRLAQLLYQVNFVSRKVPTWHADVRYYDVFERRPDGRRGEFIGGIYLDLFPREGKYNHAAAYPVRSVSTLARRTPISVLVTNFNRAGLDHDELETLLHEFGHVLHGVLSKTRYAEQGGTAVRRDFVEAPSQMFEEWARREEPLALFAAVCPECPKLTSDQIRRLDGARKFGRGIFFRRQWQYALYDMRLHTGQPPPALATWAEIEAKSRLGHVEGSLFPARFSHLLGGYAAGYYGYMWSQVLALDMLSAFDGKLLNPAVGRRYRQTILAAGGQRPPHALVEAFLGRAPNSDAFYAEITGKR